MFPLPHSKNMRRVEGVKTKNQNNVIKDHGTIRQQIMDVRLSISGKIFHWNLDMSLIHLFILEC